MTTLLLRKGSVVAVDKSAYNLGVLRRRFPAEGRLKVNNHDIEAGPLSAVLGQSPFSVVCFQCFRAH